MEAAVPKTILSIRAITTFGTWNVRTMYEAGKTAQVAAEMRKHNLAILGINEARWTGSGQRRLTTGELLLYSGHEDVSAHQYAGSGFDAVQICTEGIHRMGGTWP